jgi:hypothetical protein
MSVLKIDFIKWFGYIHWFDFVPLRRRPKIVNKGKPGVSPVPTKCARGAFPTGERSEPQVG